MDTGLAPYRLAASGFREYDMRWRYPGEIDLAGMRTVGLGLGTQMQRRGLTPSLALGHDFRSYAPEVADALATGLVAAGIAVSEIGMCLTPMAWFAQGFLGTGAVAMVTASHNPNGWTGVKTGFAMPLTHGPAEMAELRDIVLGGEGQTHPGGSRTHSDGVQAACLDRLAAGPPLARRLRVVCATGNGTAGAFAPGFLARLGAEVIPLHCDLDASFPHYNPNPEALEMLHDMARAVRESGADLALGFDGDGDRCGVVDDTGEEIFADKMGVLLARDLAARHPGARFVADVKSTGLFAADPVLRGLGATTEYWKTGHSHMKARLAETGALAGFEKSGHFFFGPPVGEGWDCGLRTAAEILRLFDRHPGRRLSDLRRTLPQSWTTPTLSPACPDGEKYAVVARLTDRLAALQAEGALFADRLIARLVTVNGARVELEGGGFALVRASSNTPNLVVVCESLRGPDDLRAIFGALDRLIREEPAVGAYDQMF